jgi:hypothetical protein
MGLNFYFLVSFLFLFFFLAIPGFEFRAC